MSELDSSAVPYGYCECGCGERTNATKYADKITGQTNDAFARFVRGHQPKRLGGFRHFCNHDFFSSVDTEQKAYWLGFIAADGCIAEPRTVVIGLSADDHAHLARFKAALNSTHPITTYARSFTAGSFGNSTLASRIQIVSEPLVNGLRNYGVISRKSQHLQWPSTVAPDLLRHYLRGYFDGDGWFTSSMHHACKRPQFFWRMNGTEQFCLGAQSYLMEAVGAQRVKLRVEHRCENTYLLSYGGNRQVKRIYGLMYDGATVWLPRKRDRAATLIG